MFQDRLETSKTIISFLKQCSNRAYNWISCIFNIDEVRVDDVHDDRYPPTKVIEGLKIQLILIWHVVIHSIRSNLSLHSCS